MHTDEIPILLGSEVCEVPREAERERTGTYEKDARGRVYAHGTRASETRGARKGARDARERDARE